MWFDDDMPATAAPTHRPVNLAAATWTVGRMVATFDVKAPGFGVQNIATGEFLSSDGVNPSAWGSKAVAAAIAETPMAWATVPVVLP
jgi:hypothetical protein